MKISTSIFLSLFLFSCLFSSCVKNPECEPTPLASLNNEAEQWLNYPVDAQTDINFKNSQNEIATLVAFSSGKVFLNSGLIGLEGNCPNPMMHQIKEGTLFNLMDGIGYAIRIDSVSQLSVYTTTSNTSPSVEDKIRFDALTKEIYEQPIFFDLNFETDFSFQNKTYEEVLIVNCNDALSCDSNKRYGFMLAKNTGFIQVTFEDGTSWTLDE